MVFGRCTGICTIISSLSKEYIWSAPTFALGRKRLDIKKVSPCRTVGSPWPAHDESRSFLKSFPESLYNGGPCVWWSKSGNYIFYLALTVFTALAMACGRAISPGGTASRPLLVGVKYDYHPSSNSTIKDGRTYSHWQLKICKAVLRYIGVGNRKDGFEIACTIKGALYADLCNRRIVVVLAR